jgi:hypothetical protein
MAYSDLKSKIEASKKAKLASLKGKNRTNGYDFDDNGRLGDRTATCGRDAYKAGGSVKAEAVKGVKRLDRVSRSAKKKAEGGSVDDLRKRYVDDSALDLATRRAARNNDAVRSSGAADDENYRENPRFKHGGKIMKRAEGGSTGTKDTPAPKPMPKPVPKPIDDKQIMTASCKKSGGRAKKAEGGEIEPKEISMEDKIGMNQLMNRVKEEKDMRSGEKDPTRGDKYAGEKDYKKGGKVDNKFKGKFAAGGKVKDAKTSINIVIAPQGASGPGGDAMQMKPMPLPMVAAMGAPIPPRPMPTPPAPIQLGGPIANPQGANPMMPSMPRKTGGRTNFTGGAGSGVGRLELSKATKK